MRFTQAHSLRQMIIALTMIMSFVVSHSFASAAFQGPDTGLTNHHHHDFHGHHHDDGSSIDSETDRDHGQAASDHSHTAPGLPPAAVMAYGMSERSLNAHRHSPGKDGPPYRHRRPPREYSEN